MLFCKFTGLLKLDRNSDLKRAFGAFYQNLHCKNHKLICIIAGASGDVPFNDLHGGSHSGESPDH